MSNFKIPSNPPTTQKSIRFPNNLIEKIENRLVGTECTFSLFVIEATKMTLKDLEQKEE